MRVFWRTARLSSRLVAAFLVGGSACVGAPHTVAATTTGGGSFSATVMLDVFPCYSGGCAATIAGTAGLSLSGLGTQTANGTIVPVPYTAAWVPTEAVLTGTFTYQDTCELGQPDGTVPLSGNGGGSFTLSGGSAVVGDTLTAATLSGGFAFTRVGDGLRITLSNLTITPPSGSPVLAVNLTGAVAGQSVAPLVWTNGPGTCGGASNQVLSQTAAVVGGVLQPV